MMNLLTENKLMVTIRGQMEQFQSLALILGTSLNFFLFFFFYHSISWPQYSSSKMEMAVLQGYYCIKTTFITKLKKYFLSSLSILIPGKLSTCLGLNTTRGSSLFCEQLVVLLGPLCTCFWDLDPTLSPDK